MPSVEKINGIETADIDSVNAVECADATSVNDVDITCAFANRYSLAVGNIVVGHGELEQGTYVDIANQSNYHFRSNPGSGLQDDPFSLSIWFNAPAASPGCTQPCAGVGVGMLGMQALFGKGRGGAAGNLEYRLMFYAPNATVNFTLYTDSNNYIYIHDGNYTSLEGAWHHIVATYDGSEHQNGLNYYIDGSLIGSPNRASWGTYNGLKQSNKSLTVGGILTQSNSQCTGYLDEASVWSKALTTADVALIYNGGTPPDLNTHVSASQLYSWWRMGDNNASGSSFIPPWAIGTAVTDVAPTPHGNGTLLETPTRVPPVEDGFVLVVP